MEDEVVKILLDDMPVTRFIAFYIIALIGMFVFFAAQVNKAIKTDPKTPFKFSWKSLFNFTTILRLFSSIVILAFSVVYYEELLVMLFNVEVPGQINAIGALILGISIDKIVDGLVGTTVGLVKKR